MAELRSVEYDQKVHVDPHEHEDDITSHIQTYRSFLKLLRTVVIIIAFVLILLAVLWA